MPDSPSSSPVPALEMIDVTVGSLRRPELEVLESVNWRVATGDYWVIGGLEATGKSDLLATAAGLLPPVRGSYRVFGKELSPGYEQELLAARLAVALVFDGGRLLHHLTVAENVALPLQYHANLSMAACAEQVEALLDLVAMTAFAPLMPTGIGRNAQQRVGLARALALKPQVLLLDNPLSGVDPRDAAWWLGVLDQLAAGHPVTDRRPLTLVVTGDDLRPWRNRARQFAALKNRQFLALGDRAGLRGHTEPLLRELLHVEETD